MDFSFNSKEELYQLVIPALEVKKNELNKFGYNYIKRNDIWNYLIITKWSKSHNLELNDIVNDILNCDNKLIDKYIKDKLSTTNEEDINLEVI